MLLHFKFLAVESGYQLVRRHGSLVELLLEQHVHLFCKFLVAILALFYWPVEATLLDDADRLCQVEALDQRVHLNRLQRVQRHGSLEPELVLLAGQL